MHSEIELHFIAVYNRSALENRVNLACSDTLYNIEKSTYSMLVHKSIAFSWNYAKSCNSSCMWDAAGWKTRIRSTNIPFVQKNSQWEQRHHWNQICIEQWTNWMMLQPRIKAWKCWKNYICLLQTWGYSWLWMQLGMKSFHQFSMALSNQDWEMFTRCPGWQLR